MSNYRGELRVFGLIGISILACALLYGGLSSAQVDGEILGISFSVAGPAGLFVLLLVIYAWQRLLTFEVAGGPGETISRPMDKMDESEAARAIDDLQSDINELTRHQERLRKYHDTLAAGQAPEAALATIGIRPAKRGGVS